MVPARNANINGSDGFGSAGTTDGVEPITAPEGLYTIHDMLTYLRHIYKDEEVSDELIEHEQTSY